MNNFHFSKNLSIHLPPLRLTSDAPNNEGSTTEENMSGEILVLMGLLFVSLAGGHLLKKIQMKMINEPLFATLIGLIAGSILYSTNNEHYIDDITSGFVKFFIILFLPPIIFESAYNTRRKDFFKNIGTIMIFAVIGTLISILFIGLAMWSLSLTGIYQSFSLREAFAYGSLISSTDPVAIVATLKEYSTDPFFFQIVFGESILNDAVSIVFYETCVNYHNRASISSNVFSAMLYFLIVMICSTLIGLIVGFLTALTLKLISGKVSNIQKIEISLMVILPWVSYLIAQMLGLSGIVSVLFNGIAHATYTKPNLTDWSKITVKTSYEAIAHIFETLVFIFIGIGFFSFKLPYDQLSVFFVIFMTIFILFGRWLNVRICTFFANLSRQDNIITRKKEFFLWFAGIRGAMAFALSIKSKFDFPDSGPIFLVMTLIFSSFTLLYSGIFLDITIRKCEIVNMCEADNFEESSFRTRSCFEAFKSHLESFNDRYLMNWVYREEKEDEKRNSWQMQDIKTEKPSQLSPGTVDIQPQRNENDGGDYKKTSLEVSNSDKRNLQIKNMHLFE